MIRYASFGRRLWAMLLAIFVDLLVLWAMRAIIGAGEVAAPFTLWLLLHHIGLVTEGGNVGHRLAGLRVTTVDGERVGPVAAFIRLLTELALSIPPLFLGMLWMLDQPERRCWHDLLAGTVVVRESVPEHAPAPTWTDDPPWRRPATVASSQQESSDSGDLVRIDD